eukprot:TRINITY_DN7447_c0_g1_i3.p5 TRINITY_DN7447_c0_g1~~TRINITY_DN7447_c0_g1_i3.p5  ORF type:complete len:120 (+),score=33.74 TRINITY_DN7447_c0_g1_i3:602-961(+)
MEQALKRLSSILYRMPSMHRAYEGSLGGVLGLSAAMRMGGALPPSRSPTAPASVAAATPSPPQWPIWSAPPAQPPYLSTVPLLLPSVSPEAGAAAPSPPAAGGGRRRACPDRPGRRRRR